MVTCSLNGGSNVSGDHLHSDDPQAGVLCKTDQDGNHLMAGSVVRGQEAVPMEISPAVHPVLNLKLDHHDHPDTVSVTLYIKTIQEDSLQVEFEERKITAVFRTSDKNFLRQYPNFEAEDLFEWQIETRGPILPSQCSYHLKPTNLELKLIKSTNGKWESLEAVGSLPALGRPVRNEKWISLAPKTAKSGPSLDSNRIEDDDDAMMIQATLVTTCRPGYTGLANLGNTCYMNSVLQCLANTTPLKNYFIDKKFQSEINRENVLGFGGSLAVSFAVILRQLWTGQRDSIEPSTLKNLLSNRASQFSGYAQHDAQEFMAFLLDGLHEDLNRVKCKPLTTAVESDGRPDPVVAEEAWRVYKMRNDSVIVDLFQGQYRSTLVCPECSKVPDEMGSELSAVRVTLWLDPTLRVEHLKQELKRLYADRFRPGSNVEVVQARDGLIRRWLVDPAPLSSLHNNPDDIVLMAFETLAPTEGTALVHIGVVQRMLVPPDDHTHCSGCKRESSELKRCLKCYSVAYCNKNCQKSHWHAVHRSMCKPKPIVFAQPFVLSLPPKALTYQALYKAMLHYSKFSVDARRGVAIGNKQDAADSFSPSSSSSSSSYPSSPVSCTPPEDLQQEHPQEKKQVQPWFFIKAIDSQGQSIAGKGRLEDRGEEPVLMDLEVDESPVFLAMDWRNHERSECVVTERMRFEGVEEASSASQEQPLKLTLHHCLEQFMRAEVLSREEAWYCPQCKEHREASKQMSLWRLPEILTIQLKRFSFRNLLWRDKIDRKVHFPIRGLDLSPYLSTSCGTDGAVYDLFAVVNHYGGILYGHYTAFARCPSAKSSDHDDTVGWRCMDDRQVRDVDAESVVTPAAYLLLYRRRDGQHGPPEPKPSVDRPLRYSDPEEID